MIKLTRRRVATGFPSNLHGKGRIALKLKLIEEERRIQKDPALRHEFDSDVWPRAKKMLKEEASNKCAYCEAPTATVAHGDVEHYRPKSHYWWLVYCVDNYFFSCQICNQTFKLDEFPIHGKRMQIDPPFPNPFPETMSKADLAALAARLAPDPLDDAAGLPIALFQKAALKEKAGIVDPYRTDPEPLFKWEADDVNGEVWIRARSKKVESKRAHAAAETFLGLNREELRRQRYETYTFARVMSLSLDSVTDAALKANIRALLIKMLAPSSPFAGMVRYFVRDVWKTGLD